MNNLTEFVAWLAEFAHNTSTEFPQSEYLKGYKAGTLSMAGMILNRLRPLTTPLPIPKSIPESLRDHDENTA